MINWNLLTPRNIATVGVIAIAFHQLVKPLYAIIANKGANAQ